MKLSLVTPNPSNTITGALGISDERKKEIYNRCKEIVEKEAEDAEGNHARTIATVWNEFESNPAECAFALYILRHEETKVEMTTVLGEFAESVAS